MTGHRHLSRTLGRLHNQRHTHIHIHTHTRTCARVLYSPRMTVILSSPPSTGAVIELASFVFCVAYLVCVLFCIERSATQPVSPQMFHASRKRERGRMDGGRSGVLQETPTARLQHDWVRCPFPCPIDQKK